MEKFKGENPNPPQVYHTQLTLTIVFILLILKWMHGFTNDSLKSLL